MLPTFLIYGVIIEKLPELPLVDPTADEIYLDAARSYARKTIAKDLSENCPIWVKSVTSKTVFDFAERFHVHFNAQIQAP